VSFPTRSQFTTSSQPSLTSPTNTYTFGVACVAGNLIAICLAGDKNTGTISVTDNIGTNGGLNPWIIEVSVPGTSVSTYVAWKVAVGGETVVTVTTSANSTTGNTGYGEEQVDDGAGAWTVVAKAVPAYSDTSVTSTSSGTTDTADYDGRALAVGAIDSMSNLTSDTGPTFTNFTRINVPTRPSGSGGGNAGCYVGEANLAAGATTSTTFATNGGSDQLFAAIAAFGRVEASSTTGSLSATAPKPTSAISGTVRATGAMDTASPRPTTSVAGTVTATAAIAGTTPRPAAAVTGTVGHVATLSATAPMPTGSIVGDVRATGALAGVSPKPTAALTGTAEAPPLPSEVLDLSYWHLTTPEDSGEGDAEQIDQPELATYSSANFYVDEQGRVVCRAPVNGFTTSGASGATRMELRQRRKGTYALAAIDPHAAGRWQMTGTSYVDATSITGGSAPRKEGIFAQIHGAGDSPIPLILAAEYHVATPRVRIYKNGPGFDNPVTGIDPDTPISYRIRIENDRLKLWVIAGLHTDLPPITSTAPYDWPISDFTDDSGWYYKDGAYNKTLVTSGSSGEFISKIAHLEILEPADADPSVASGPLVAITPKPTAVFAATITDAAQFSGTTPSPSASLSGTVVAAGTLSATTPRVTGAIDATGEARGPLAAVTPSPSIALSGTVTAGGTLSGALPLPVAALAGDVATLTGVLAAVTPLPRAALHGQAGGDGSIEAGTPTHVSAVRVGSLTRERGPQAGVPRKVVTAGAGSPRATD